MACKNYQNKNPSRNPCLIIRKLVDLMSHPISRNANERNLQLLRDFLNASHYAFWLPTIPDLIHLYEILSKKIEEVPEFREPLECLLHFSATPPMMKKVSDQIEYSRDFQEYFSTLGYLIICLHDEELGKLVLNAIIHLLKIRKPLHDNCVTLAYIKEMIEKSKLPEILIQLTQVVSDTLYPLLLEATLLVSGISKSTSRKMAQENGIDYVMRRLDPTWQTRDQEIKPQNPIAEDKILHVETACCILWKLLNSVQNDTENIPTPSSFAIWSLQYVFRWSFVFPDHRTERNNLAAIILKILDTFPQIEFVESELINDVALLAVAATGQIRSVKDDETEFQFKKIILACLFYYKNYKVDKVVKEHNVMSALIKFLFCDCQNETVNHAHYCGLLKIVIKLIPEFLPVSVDIFLALNTPAQITSSLQTYATYDIHVLEAYMYCTHKSLQADNDVLVAFGEAGIFTVAALVCNQILDNATLTNVHQKCIGRGFCILQIAAAANYGSRNVILDVCFKYLNRVVHPKQTDPVLDVRIVACALHSLWGCVNDKYHNKFLKKGGAYILLDVAEACPFPVKNLVLGILVDLLRRSLCVPYLITWRKRGLTLLPMLMEIFRGAAEISCSDTKRRFSTEKIDNTRVALCRGQRPTFQNYCVTQNEMLQTCRYRIHGIIDALKVKYKQKVNLANMHYKLYSEKLNTDDELTMLFAENFLSLTMCETWVAMAEELKVEGIVPVDGVLRDKIDGIRQWRVYFQSLIEKKVVDEMQRERNSEYQTYVLLNEARLTDALDALKEMRFVSTCTERMFQLSKKIRLSQEVEPLYKKNINYHRTALSLPFTNVFDQTIKIQSDVIYENLEESDLAPVSPGSESDFDIKYSEDELSEHGLEC